MRLDVVEGVSLRLFRRLGHRALLFRAFIRIGRTTNKAAATTRIFRIDATTNTACQLPVCVFSTFASGTTKADIPFAEYIRAVLVVAYCGPKYRWWSRGTD